MGFSVFVSIGYFAELGDQNKIKQDTFVGKGTAEIRGGNEAYRIKSDKKDHPQAHGTLKLFAHRTQPRLAPHFGQKLPGRSNL